MMEFWELNFREKQEMWGLEPSESSTTTLELFKKHQLNKILIPGFGYGRNADIFYKNNFDVTGIEISETAINLAHKHYNNKIKVHHGSVTDMPFDSDSYDGIYCYALIHLLNARERRKLIQDCYTQLNKNGLMVFVAIATDSPTYGIGKKLSTDRFKTGHGVNLFFYNELSIHKEFDKYGLIEAKLITESNGKAITSQSLKFWQIICKK